MSFYHRRQLHDSFESRVYAELEQRGFVVHDLTYHTHLERETVDRLKRIRTPTALLVRTRADRIAMHQTMPLVAKIEVKTSGYANGSFALDAFQLATHIIEAHTLGAQCLYICFQRTVNYEFGFWASEIRDRIAGIYVPPYWHGFVREFPDWLLSAFPDAPVRWLTYETQGSNTPYVLMSPSTVRSLGHWQTLLCDWLGAHQAQSDQPQPPHAGQMRDAEPPVPP